MESRQRPVRRPPAADRMATAAELKLLIGRLARRIRAGHPAGLTTSQLSTVAAVEAHQPVRISDLAAVEDVAVPTMTRLVAGLAERGLVERHPDPADGRSVLVTLSPAGVARLDELRRERTTFLARHIERLSDDDYRKVVAALPALHALVADDESAVG